jgi:hypothetical protein
MRFPARLLRTLLSLLLVLNGTTTAFASARMVLTTENDKPVAESGAAVETHARGVMPCHEHMAATDHAIAAAKAASAKSQSPSHGCCGAANCHCACSMQAPMALLSDGPRIAAHGAHDRSERALPLAHAPPTRRPPIRPPIG